mmetsp:Transcript_15817/g.34225  ORF Transcript_15817/g.34225 Transcript_15817/m.34225 type:complete len:100 (-) Transcript_15817:263-562(-)
MMVRSRSRLGAGRAATSARPTRPAVALGDTSRTTTRTSAGKPTGQNHTEASGATECASSSETSSANHTIPCDRVFSSHLSLKGITVKDAWEILVDLLVK